MSKETGLETHGLAQLPDDALVLRGGQNLPENFKRGSGVTVDPEGNLKGVSVNCAPGKPVEVLAKGIPNAQVGVTTVGAIRAVGGQVIPSPTPNNPYHCLMCGISADKASSLMKLLSNPAKPKLAEPFKPFEGQESR